ncbi:proprotein convertase P-domain-containing protein [Pseudoalteromonas sp. YIC-656]|uniref:proprotein convertase P-domain-containing protein n=1 Tax=Pseudoalteromonas pernae TaxID=3118054 RepID=UPI0032423104
MPFSLTIITAGMLFVSTISNEGNHHPVLHEATGLGYQRNNNNHLNVFDILNPFHHSLAPTIGQSSSESNKVKPVSAQRPTEKVTLSCPTTEQTVNAGTSATFEFSLDTQNHNKQTDKNSANVTAQQQWQLSVASPLPGASLSTPQLVDKGQFSLTVPTQQHTQNGKYTFTVTAGSERHVQQSAVMLNVIPAGAQSVTFANEEIIHIEDNSATATTSTIYVPNPLTTYSLEVELAVRHTWRSDLEVTLISPSGNQHILHNRDGGSLNDIYQHYQINTFNGESAHGTWTLSVADRAPGNIGALTRWRLNLVGFAPAP